MRFGIKRKNAGLVVGLAAILLAAAALAGAQEAAKPKVSDQPLTAEQLAIYREVLHGWMENEVSTINLSVQTVPLTADGLFGYEGCDKGLELETAAPDVVHRFRAADLAQLGSGKISLVDPQRGSKEVAENDPGKTIREGRSIEDAVRNGFDHGLVTLSEIRFNKGHTKAMVSFRFLCGSLCGNGGSVVLEKTDGGWKRGSRCHDWVS
jgi:hypothetical protein